MPVSNILHATIDPDLLTRLRELLEQAGDGAFIPERWAETKATTPGTAWRTCGGAG